MSAPSFEFISSAVTDKPFRVVAFEGREALSRLYRYDIELKAPSNADIDLDEVLNGSAQFICWHLGQDYPVNGMLASFEEQHSARGYTYYRAVLVPRLWRLSLYRTNEIYTTEKTVDKIVDHVLSSNDFISGQDYRIHIQSSLLLQRDYVCQFRESDFGFIARLLEHEGLYFYFEQHDDRECLVITDASQYSALENPQLAYDSSPQGSRYFRTINAWSCSKKRVPARVSVRDYNPEQPSLDVAGNEDIDTQGSGVDYLYGENFQNEEEAEYLARLRAEQYQCEKTRFHGRSGVCFLRPGFSLSLSGHPNSKYNQGYLLVEVRHRASQLDDQGGEHVEPSSQYGNDFVAIADSLQYRPPLLTPKPRFHGTMTAFVYAETDSERAEVDAQGRYRVLLPFDRVGKGDSAKASAWIRMATPYAGEERGMYFPLMGGTEVLLSFIDGDPDRPIISAALPNAAQPALLTSDDDSSKFYINGTLMERFGNRHRAIGKTQADTPAASADVKPPNNDSEDNKIINPGGASQPGDMRPPWERGEEADPNRIDFVYYQKDFTTREMTEDDLSQVNSDRISGDNYGYSNSRTFYYPQHERVYFIGTFHEDFHLKDDFTDPNKSWTGQREVFHFPEPGGEADQAALEKNPAKVRGVTEDKRWGDQMTYAWGRSFNWAAGPGVGGSFQVFNYGNSYTENLLEKNGGTAEKHYPHSDHPRQDLYKDYDFFDPAIASIEKTFGNTFSYQKGSSIEVREGKSISKAWGDSEEEIHGNQTSTIRGDQQTNVWGRDDSQFMGGSSSCYFGGTSEVKLDVSNSLAAGLSTEIFLGGKVEISGSAKVEISYGGKIEIDNVVDLKKKAVQVEKQETRLAMSTSNIEKLAADIKTITTLIIQTNFYFNKSNVNITSTQFLGVSSQLYLIS